MFKICESKSASLTDDELKNFSLEVLGAGLIYIRSISGYGCLPKKIQKVTKNVCYEIADAMHNIPACLMDFKRTLLLGELDKLALIISKIPEAKIVRSQALKLIDEKLKTIVAESS
ncbi:MULTISPECIES: hypothetical protein [Bacillus]|uniref:hypothetical protein n=1 Tax=Bacillus TaxID=1386 RepID=UPI001ABDDAD9|nr:MULTISPECIES: hypothetical protein [Bacillus]MBR7817988.1 hypothetical protein [Bacillus sp. CCNWLCWHY013]MDJ0479952.1 hypothetical protein [Bacillus amyloliquefaciens]QTG87464.1 hypothetical protein J4048_21785 [Bacillus amyloliquefaciens]